MNPPQVLIERTAIDAICDPSSEQHHVVSAAFIALLDEFERARAAEAATFRGLSASDLARTGRHSVAGPITIAELLNHVAYHDLLHVQQIAGTLALVPNAGRGAFGMF